MDKVHQDTVVKQSVVEPARVLDPQFRVDEYGKVISEQELIEQRQRRAELEQKAADTLRRRERWADKDAIEILTLEIERHKPGTTTDETFSIRRRGDGAIDVHLHGRQWTILPHVVSYSGDSETWHITAKGAVKQLKTAAVRPDVPREYKQSDIYEEQAAILRDLAGEAGLLDLEGIQQNLKAMESLDAALRWKTELSFLFLQLRTWIQEHKCQTSQPQPPQQPQAKPPQPPRAKKAPAKKRQRRKAGAPLANPSAPAGHGLEDYQTTSHS